MIREGGERWLKRGFQIVLGRNPTPVEKVELHADYHTYLEHYREKPEQAESLLNIGQREYDPQLDPAGIASMALIASTILNLDEALTRE